MWRPFFATHENTFTVKSEGLCAETKSQRLTAGTTGQDASLKPLIGKEYNNKNNKSMISSGEEYGQNIYLLVPKETEKRTEENQWQRIERKRKPRADSGDVFSSGRITLSGTAPQTATSATSPNSAPIKTDKDGGADVPEARVQGLRGRASSTKTIAFKTNIGQTCVSSLEAKSSRKICDDQKDETQVHQTTTNDTNDKATTDNGEDGHMPNNIHRDKPPTEIAAENTLSKIYHDSNGQVQKEKVFRLLFGNVTCWGQQAEKYLINTDHDLWIAAETHLSEDRCLDVKDRLKHKGWKVQASHAYINTKSEVGRNALAKKNDPGRALSSGLLMGSKNNLGVTNICATMATKTNGSFINATGPDIIAGTWRSKQTSIVVIGAYFDTSSQNQRIVQLKKVGCFISQLASPFILAADFNMTPKELAQTGFLRKLKGAVLKVPDAAFTCTTGKGRILDYFIVSEVLIPAIKWIMVLLDTPWKPHLGIELGIAQIPTEQLVYKQPKPQEMKEAFYGPDLPWEHYVDVAQEQHQKYPDFCGDYKKDWTNTIYTVDMPTAAKLAKKYAVMSTASEFILHRRCEEPQKQKSGRGLNWKTIQTKALRSIEPDANFSDVSASLRNVISARLQDIFKFKDTNLEQHQRVQEISLYLISASKLLPQPEEDDDEEIINHGLWEQRLQKPIIQKSAEDIKAFSEEAGNKAQKTQAKASKGASIKFGKWCQAALERNASIAQKYVSKHKRLDPDEGKIDVEGNVLTLSSEILKHRASFWAEKWNRKCSNLNKLKELFKVLEGNARKETLSKIDLSMLRKALKRLSSTKGVGLDFWHPPLPSFPSK